jgi:hypothetical protein
VTKEIKARDWQGKIIGCVGLSLLDYRDVAEEDAEGVVFVSLGARGWAMDRQAEPCIFAPQQHVDLAPQAWIEWQERYWALFGQEYFYGEADSSLTGANPALVSNMPEFFSYSVLYILKDALERTDDIHNGDQLRKAMESVNLSGIWHHDFRFTPDSHDALTAQDLVLFEYRDGFMEPVPLSDY